VDILKVADKIEADLEMHDKLIVATALCFNAALITKDQFLRVPGICLTIWKSVKDYALCVLSLEPFSFAFLSTVRSAGLTPNVFIFH
jgi:hypothetical protein